MATRVLILTLLLPFIATGLASSTGVRGSSPGQPYLGPDPDVRTVPITLGGKTVTAVIADSDLTRTKGLLDWERITDDAGMLLDFARERTPAIHMQGMKFAIDAVWIDDKSTVTMVYESIQPDSGIVYPSVFPSRYCLELNAGFCKRYDIKIGQKVIFGVPGNRPH